MAIFTNTTVEKNYDLPVFEGYGLENAEYMTMFTEACDDELAVIEAMYDFDMTEILGKRKINKLIETKTEEDEDYNPEEDNEIDEITEELNISLEEKEAEVKKTFKQKILTLWGKIKAFFESVGRFIRNIFLNVEKFYKTYAERVGNLTSKVNFKVNMYPYTTVKNSGFKFDIESADKELNALHNTFKDQLGNISPKDEAFDKNIDEFNQKYEEKFASFDKKLMGKLVGEKECDPDKFADKLKEYYRGGDKKEVTIDAAKVKEFNTFLNNVNKQQEIAKKAKTESDKIFEKLISDIDAIKEDNGKKIASIRKFSKLVEKRSSIMTRAINNWANILNECARAYMTVIRKAITKDQYANA